MMMKDGGGGASPADLTLGICQSSNFALPHQFALLIHEDQEDDHDDHEEDHDDLDEDIDYITDDHDNG